jgi:hypothetical protein
VSLRIYQFIPGDNCEECPWDIYRPCEDYRKLFGAVRPTPGEPLCSCSSRIRPDGVDMIVKEIK